MTDTQESMRGDFLKWLQQPVAETDCNVFQALIGHCDDDAWWAWQAATAQSAEKIASLEAEVEKERKFHIMEQEMRIAEEKKSAAAELNNKQLREAIQKVVAYCTDFEAVDDLDAALAQPISTEALDAYVAKLIPPGWKVVPIEPTKQMLVCMQGYTERDMRGRYAQLLDAAPLPPAPEE